MHYNWKSKKILIVEDERDCFLLLKTILKVTNATIIHAGNGQDAIDICRKNKQIDAVLMDIQLPYKNGLQATMEIKEFKSSLPIIAQTAFAMQNESEACIKAGCDNYITKPINRKQLLLLLSHYLGN